MQVSIFCFKFVVLKIKTMNYELIKKDLTKDGDSKYTIYFYLKNHPKCYEVVCDGTRCGIVVQEQIGISGFKTSLSLPKYITNNLTK